MNGLDTGMLVKLVLVLILLGIGIFSVISGLRNRKKGAASLSWPTADGVITNAWIEEKTDTDEDGITSTTYTPRWEYQYQVEGTTYTSSRISYGAVKGYGRRSKAQEELGQYPAHSTVKVYFDPYDFTETVLVPGTKGTLLGIIIGAVLILISIGIAATGLF